MKVERNGRAVPEDELVLEWRDVHGFNHAHLVLLDDGCMAMAICGREFPAKDIMPGSDQEPRCKSCLQQERDHA